MGNIKDTQYFQAVQDKKIEVSDVLEQVYIALTEKGYNPVNQIVGYIMSGDPTYITSHKGARSLIMKVERDEILEELMAVYIDARLKYVPFFKKILPLTSHRSAARKQKAP